MNANTWIIIFYVVIGLLGLASLWVLFRTKSNAWRVMSLGGIILTFLGLNGKLVLITDLTILLVIELVGYLFLAIGLFMSSSKR